MRLRERGSEAARRRLLRLVLGWMSIGSRLIRDVCLVVVLVRVVLRFGGRERREVVAGAGGDASRITVAGVFWRGVDRVVRCGKLRLIALLHSTSLFLVRVIRIRLVIEGERHLRRGYLLVYSLRLRVLPLRGELFDLLAADGA